MKGFIGSCGGALILGGLLLVLINVVLTPMLPAEQDEAVTRASAVYLVRMSLSGVAAMLLLFGSVGVYLAHRDVFRVFGAVAFGVVFIANSLVVALEWSNVFVLRAVAQSSPEALQAIGDSTLMTIGFAMSASLFALGWLLLAVSILRAGVFARWIPLAIIGGLVAIPALGATPMGMAGAIVGNVIFGFGIAGLGRALTKGD